MLGTRKVFEEEFVSDTEENRMAADEQASQADGVVPAADGSATAAAAEQKEPRSSLR